MAKRNFVCESLGIDYDGTVLKSMIRKITSREYPKDSIVVAERDRQDFFMLVRKGAVRLVKSVQGEKRSHNINAAILS